VSTNPVMGTSEGRRRRNKSWPEALKREIVAASYAPGSSVSLVSRRYDVNANQVFKWRKLFGEGADGSPQLVPVMVEAEQPIVDVAARVSGDIMIEVGGRYRVRVGETFDGRTLCRILDVLEDR
jgi:transposase